MKNISWTKISGILIIGIFLFIVLVRHYLEFYRGAWIYRNLSPILLFVQIGLIIWSLLNTIYLLKKHKSNLIRNSIWILLSVSLFLYNSTMVIISMFTPIY
jgi:hypothetical protein